MRGSYMVRSLRRFRDLAPFLLSLSLLGCHEVTGHLFWSALPLCARPMQAKSHRAELPWTELLKL